MAASPRYKIFDNTGEYVGSAKYEAVAAAFVSTLGDGASVRYGHRKQDTVWVEGAMGVWAADSYDAAGQTIYERSNDKMARYV